MTGGDWLGVPSEMWSGIVGGVVGALVGAVAGGWIANRSASRERLLNRVSRLLELYQEHTHQLIETEHAIRRVYESLEEHNAAARQGRAPGLPSPLDRLDELHRRMEEQLATFRLIACHEADPRRTVPLKGIADHLALEVQCIGNGKYDDAYRHALTRGNYATHLRNAVTELHHQLPRIPRLGFWGKIRWESASHEKREEEKRLEAFTSRVVAERLAEERAAAEQQRNPRRGD
jgi:hypothetical protein